jgi:hypothetical protein
LAIGGYNFHDLLEVPTMFGIGFWELVIIAIVGVLLCGIPVAVILTVMAMSAGSRNRGPDDPGI